MSQTYRDLLYLGAPMDIATFVARSGERGYIGYAVTIDTATAGTPAQCECPGWRYRQECWHVKEAPKALFYVQQRERFRLLDDDFAAFFGEWWPRYEEATKGGDYLGKACADWQVFYAALLDEEHERKAYTRRYVGQVREMFDAVEVG